MISIPILLILSFLIEFQGYIKFYNEKWIPKTVENSDYLWGLGFGIFISSVSTFAISYSTSWSMRVTSSTTYRYVYIVC